MLQNNKYSTQIEFISISNIQEKQRIPAAYLIMESLPDYYYVPNIDLAEMSRAVAVVIGKKNSETENGILVIMGNNIIGILTYLPAEKLATAQLIGAQSILKKLSPSSARIFRQHLKNYNSDFKKIPPAGIYLSRITVQRNYRGTTIAFRLMKTLLKTHNAVSLHVNKNNTRAINFYKKCGFIILEAGKQYLTMTTTALQPPV